MVALFRMPPQSLHGGSRSPARTRSSTCCIGAVMAQLMQDRKSTRLNSSHGYISYAVFCLKKKKQFYLAAFKVHPRSPHTAQGLSCLPAASPSLLKASNTHRSHENIYHSQQAQRQCRHVLY